MIWMDGGNTHVHVLVQGRIEHLKPDAAVRRYHAQRVAYINVNPHNAALFSAIAGWEDLAPRLHLTGAYRGMGIDRIAICLAYPDGIFVDAGSAVTVDVVDDGVYQGGFIAPGFHAYARTYAAISPVLDVPFDREIDISVLPKTTREGVSFGTVAPIVAAIEKLRGSRPLYVTGGDGAWLANYWDDAAYDAALVFRGMQRVGSALNPTFINEE